MGSGYPAELYLGTYSGLCYSCTSAGPYVVEGSETVSGARYVSWPPACPSHRRDRTEHLAFADCEKCKGLGAYREGRGGAAGWDVTVSCNACQQRHYAHPIIVERMRRAGVLDEWQKAWTKRMLAEWDRTYPLFFPGAELDDEGRPAGASKEAVDELVRAIKARGPKRPEKYEDGEPVFPDGWPTNRAGERNGAKRRGRKARSADSAPK